MSSPSPQHAYAPKIKNNKGLSPLWLLPILTLVLAGWLIFKAVQDAGQQVQIYFSNAQGLVAGRTTIRYQGLEIGMVKNISLAENLQSIYVDADIYPEATKLLNKETRFWMVKPTASLSGVSGLDALVSGNYIAIAPGEMASEFETTFTALDRAPNDIIVNDGLNIALTAEDLGGISVGSKIVYKKIPIGEVYNYQLDSDSKQVIIQASIQNEYRHIITNKSRFWNVSGIGANVGFGGLDVHVESLSALIGGAIAVDSPGAGAPAAEHSEYRLYPDLKTAGRGIAIQIELPDNNKVGPNAPIMYRGIKIGQVTDLKLTAGRQTIVASAAIQPAFSDMLTTGSHLILEEAEVSLGGIENIANLVQGNFLSLAPKDGEPTRYFNAIRKEAFQRQQSHSVALTLIADHSLGLDKGADILYRGIRVGAITQVNLVDDKVQLNALVDSGYAHLIKSKNRFFITESLSAELTGSKLNLSVAPAKQLLNTSISFISQGKNKPLSKYHLYPSQSLAELAERERLGSTKINLFASELPPISKGSPLLYRNLQVGMVNGFRLVKNGVLISANIENRYRHLITPHSVFWNRSGVEIDAGLNGINVKAAPLKSLLQGGIAFDTLPGVSNKHTKSQWLLYPDFKTAKKFGKVIILTFAGKNTLSKGASINYKGVKVGEIIKVAPNFKQQNVTVTARILPEYSTTIAVNGSYFWLPKAEVGLSGVKNIQNLLAQSVSVQPGHGKAQSQFTLHANSKSLHGVHFTLQSASKSSLSVGTPVLYRDIEVGQVTSIQLGEFADRVLSEIVINPDYAYLVRRNSVFWNTSGVDVSIGLSGANIKAGTLESLVRGGITFSTPEQKQLEPIAKQGQSFYLYPQAEEDWQNWRTAIPKP